MELRVLAICLMVAGVATGVAVGQTPSMAQDSSLNNLRHPPGTATVAVGTLDHVRRFGEGRKTMLLIPGLGFGDSIWTEFMERHKTEYTMFAITLPGFGGTKPLAMPADESKFADTPWTRSTLQAINALLDKERIEKVTIMAHWALATQLALRLALDQPGRVEAVVIIGGVLKMYYESNPATLTWTLEQRRNFADAMGERWFKTVTRRTWDDNNFMSYDYAVNLRRGLYLWREAQAPTLPVWIRYLLEFYALDLSADLKDLRVPVLVVQPGFDDPAFYVEPGKNYMRNLCLDSWKGAAELSNRLEFVTIAKSRLFIQYDQPEALDRAIAAFLGKLPTPAAQKDRQQERKKMNQEFFSAITQGDVTKVKALLKADPDLARAKDEKGVSAILKATYYGKKEVVAVLLAMGIELNVFEAAATGQTERVRALLKQDMTLVNAFAPDGFFPLGLAVFFGHRETVEALLAAGADVNAVTREKMKVAPINSAAAARQSAIARLLIARGANVNAEAENGFMPLHEAAANGDLELATLLLDHGAKLNAKTKDGQTPLAFALSRNQTEMAAFLRARGAVK